VSARNESTSSTGKLTLVSSPRGRPTSGRMLRSHEAVAGPGFAAPPYSAWGDGSTNTGAPTCATVSSIQRYHRASRRARTASPSPLGPLSAADVMHGPRQYVRRGLKGAGISRSVPRGGAAPWFAACSSRAMHAGHTAAGAGSASKPKSSRPAASAGARATGGGSAARCTGPGCRTRSTVVSAAPPRPQASSACARAERLKEMTLCADRGWVREYAGVGDHAPSWCGESLRATEDGCKGGWM